MELINVNDDSFCEYGRVIDEIDFTELVSVLATTPLTNEVVYTPACKELEELPIKRYLEEVFWGESPCQIGYCNGFNKKLNALEYHRSSEINIALTDTVLLLGKLSDVKNYTYDTTNVKAFVIPAGKAVEIYATTLHYAPCNVDDRGFRVAVVLPKGTNEALSCKHSNSGEDALLAAKNKWLIGHREGGLDEGTFIGLVGENITI